MALAAFKPISSGAPLVKNFSGQTTKNTTGYSDPFGAALKAAPTAAQYQGSAGSLTATSPFSSGLAKTVSPYQNHQAPSADPVVQKIQTLSAANNPPAAPGNGAYDLQTDPTVQAQEAANQKAYSDAVAAAQAAGKTDIINSGFDLSSILAGNPDLANSPIGQILQDSTTADAAAHNPFSTAAGLRATHAHNQAGIDTTANDNNLYYSSARANNLGAEDQNYQGSVSGAQSSLGQALTALLGNLANEQSNENSSYANAISNARQNAISNGISSGQSLLGYDGNGDPIFAPLTVSGGAGGAGADTGSQVPLSTAVSVLANPSGASKRAKGGIYSIH